MARDLIAVGAPPSLGSGRAPAQPRIVSARARHAPASPVSSPSRRRRSLGAELLFLAPRALRARSARDRRPRAEIAIDPDPAAVSSERSTCRRRRRRTPLRAGTTGTCRRRRTAPDGGHPARPDWPTILRPPVDWRSRSAAGGTAATGGHGPLDPCIDRRALRDVDRRGPEVGPRLFSRAPTVGTPSAPTLAGSRIPELRCRHQGTRPQSRSCRTTRTSARRSSIGSPDPGRPRQLARVRRSSRRRREMTTTPVRSCRKATRRRGPGWAGRRVRGCRPGSEVRPGDRRWHSCEPATRLAPAPGRGRRCTPDGPRGSRIRMARAIASTLAPKRRGRPPPPHLEAEIVAVTAPRAAVVPDEEAVPRRGERRPQLEVAGDGDRATDRSSPPSASTTTASTRDDPDGGERTGGSSGPPRLSSPATTARPMATDVAGAASSGGSRSRRAGVGSPLRSLSRPPSLPPAREGRKRPDPRARRRRRMPRRPVEVQHGHDAPATDTRNTSHTAAPADVDGSPSPGAGASRDAATPFSSGSYRAPPLGATRVDVVPGSVALDNAVAHDLLALSSLPKPVSASRTMPANSTRSAPRSSTARAPVADPSTSRCST